MKLRIRNIAVTDLQNLPDFLQESIYDFKDILEPNCCFGNSRLLAQYLEDVEYVEGRWGIIHHAWNYCKGIYFDATRDLFLADPICASWDYLQKIKAPIKLLDKCFPGALIADSDELTPFLELYRIHQISIYSSLSPTKKNEFVFLKMDIC